MADQIGAPQPTSRRRQQRIRHLGVLAILLSACATPRSPERAETEESTRVATTETESRPAAATTTALATQSAPPPTAAAQPGTPEDPMPAAPPKKETSIDDLLDSSIGMAGVARGAGNLGSGRGIAEGRLGKMRHRTVSAPRMAPSAIAPVEKDNAYAMQPSAASDNDRYAHASDNPFQRVADSALSTFSIDVDTASYSNVRRFLRDGVRPPADAVRIEELVNYFSYDYAVPQDDSPVAVSSEVSSAPWNAEHRLVRIGLRSRAIEAEHAPASNLVFLVDVSGSMQDPDKLPLLKRGLQLLAKRMRPEDHVAIVVYAGASGVALPSTSGRDKGRILAALETLEAGGSTNGADGIRLAYEIAQHSFVTGGVNRVVLATDGDFNVGPSSEGELMRLIEDKRKSGVFLTVLGFGRGNLNDSSMEALADHGNGNYAYIDSIAEAHKVLVREAGSTLITVAKDVKLQIEWNPARVASYRLIGFENRILAARDFNDDKKDAGELGAGHTVTALYEVVPAKQAAARPEVDALRYQNTPAPSAAAASDELLTVKLRYKRPSEDESRLLARVIRDEVTPLQQTSQDFRWAASVAGFGMILRDSEHKGSASLSLVKELARSAFGADLNGERHELVAMMDQAGALGIADNR